MRIRDNRLFNTANPYQGDAKRVLCVCSAGLLRSPTIAWVLSNDPFNFNTRAAGTEDDFALILVDKFLLTWAQEIVCVDAKQERKIEQFLQIIDVERPIINLNIADSYEFKNPELIKIILETYPRLLEESKC